MIIYKDILRSPPEETVEEFAGPAAKTKGSQQFLRLPKTSSRMPRQGSSKIACAPNIPRLLTLHLAVRGRSSSATPRSVSLHIKLPEPAHPEC